MLFFFLVLNFSVSCLASYSFPLKSASILTSTIPAPPILPFEYDFQFEEDYTAISIGRHHGDVVAKQHTVGIQRWSYALQSTSASVMSSGVSLLTVTNYSNSRSGSTVNDLVNRTCSVTPVEGGSPYAGYDYFHNFFLTLSALGVPISYSTPASYSVFGVEYGAVRVWSAIPPGSTEQYTLVYRASAAGEEEEDNRLLVYQINGTEYLPYQGAPELVSHSVINVRTRYNIYDKNYTWPRNTFSTDCPFTANTGTCADTSSSSSQVSLSVWSFALILIAVVVVAVLISLVVARACSRGRDQKRHVQMPDTSSPLLS